MVVHLERVDCRAPGRRQSDNQRKIITPYEMICPALLPWVEEMYRGVIQRIKAFNLIVFVTIAGWTGERQVLQASSALLHAAEYAPRQTSQAQSRLACGSTRTALSLAHARPVSVLA